MFGVSQSENLTWFYPDSSPARPIRFPVPCVFVDRPLHTLSSFYNTYRDQKILPFSKSFLVLCFRQLGFPISYVCFPLSSPAN